MGDYTENQVVLVGQLRASHREVKTRSRIEDDRAALGIDR
jgi:hypothetical protein